MKYLFSIALCWALIFSQCFAGTDPLNTFPARVYTVAGVPTNGTSAIQTLTFGATITGGTFTLTYAGATTAAITWSSTNATLVANIDAALEALSTLAGGSSVTTAAGTISSGANGTVTVTMAGNYANLLVTAIGVGTNSMTGSAHTLTAAISTAGVTADGRSAPIGSLCIDSTNSNLYQNRGIALNPAWTMVGSKTITNIAGDGAVPLVNGTVFLNKGSAAAITVAAPSAIDGTRITVVSTTAFAHVVTFTGATLNDGTTGAKTTATFAAFAGATMTFVAKGSLWYLESKTVVTNT